MLPEYSDTRLKLSFIIPIAITFCSTLFKLGFWNALMITALETFFFWGLIVGFTEVFLNLNVTEREPKWKEMAFYSNIIILPLFLTGCLLPVIRDMRDAAFPEDDSWESIKTISNDLGYQFLVYAPNIIAIITTILIIVLLAISIYEVHEVEFLKSALFAIVIGVLSFTISTVLAGIPWGMD